MANLKELFKSFRAQKAYVSKSLNDLDPGVESADFTDATLALEAQTVPYIDYSNPENFVFYGSAEQYYQDAFNYIRQEYPYDGSGKEKANWEQLASGFDKYIYESVYPRVNGYVTLGKDITIGSSTVDGYWQPSRTEYIYFEGGPHPAPQIAQGDPLTNFFPSAKGATPGSNYYNEELNQQSNLEIDGERGITLEFWLRKDGYIPALESPRQIICDIWNNEAWGDADYGRFRVELSASAGEMLPNFRIELLSGSTGFTSGQVSDTNTTLILSASSVTGSWNHFALTFQNDTTQMVGKLYQNGHLVDSLVTGSTMGLVAGALVGQLGSLVTNVSGTQGARGNALLSGSLDELRFWKTARSSQQIGMNWFTQINGGTNSDFQDEINATTKYSFTNPVDLGFYYKFNEGITGIAATDSIVLDYSGRITNGSWVGYGDVPDQRSLASAMVEASASAFEYKDPILYSYNPSVSTTLNGLLQTGFNYDINNNASIYQSLPGWIRDDDAVNDRQILLKLTQVISSYFDRLQLQIQRLPRLKDINYISSSFKPLPFVDRMIDSTGLTSAELFNEAKAFEQLVSRDDFRLFSEKLDNTKNRIYQNIYNNLVYIFKSKGAEKAFRSLIRCYGVGDELIKFSLYADEVTYTIKENFESTVTKKKFADFYTLTNFTASVYQSTGAIANPDERSFLSSSVNSSFQGNTFETEIFFPKSDATTKAVATYVAFQTSSLFGLHTADPSTPNDTTWFTPDVGNFQVYAIKTGWQNKDAVFMLTGTAGGSFPLLTSSIQNDVYNNKKWNLAVRIKPTKYPWSAAIQGSEETTYDVEFLGYDTTLDVSENEFKVTGTISLADGQSFLTSSKRAYVGAHRTNFTGTVVLERSDVRIGSVRYWLDYLDDKTVFAHSKDSSNFGRYSPGRNTFLNQFGNNFGSEVTPIPEIETLALQWGFDQVTGSDASGEFFISDFSSGSVASTSSYGWLGPLVELQHPGKGIGFERSNSDVTLPEYIYTAKQQPPEILNSSDMVNIKTISDEEVFTTESRPIRYFFAVEKSMNAIITSEMIKLFATVLDFNNLIGEPVNRYRQDYKAIEKMRELFFRRVKNEAMDFEKFVDYFKWLDDTIVMLISQLFPVSANFSDSIFTMVESHVLERNKYWNKFPTLDLKLGDPEVGLYGINEMLYPYRRGSAPIPLSQSVHCVWAHARAESETFSSGDSTIDEERNIFREANDFRPIAKPATLTDISGLTPVQYEGSTFALRNFTKIYRFKADEMPVIHGGSNVARIKNVQYAHAELPFGSTTQLKVNLSEIEDDIDCNDVVNPNDKVKLRYKLTNNPIGYASGRGDIFAPWSLYSSSVDSGYAATLPIPSSQNCRRMEFNNFHNDFYGDDKEIPIQGPFTEKYVGGREYRHVPFTTPSGSRPEAWNLDVPWPNSKSFKFGFNPGGNTSLLVANAGAGRSDADWMVSFWFKRSSGISSTESLISRSNTDDWHVHMNPDGTITFRLYDSSGGFGYTETSLAKNYADGEWHLLLVYFESGAGVINLVGFPAQLTLTNLWESSNAAVTLPAIAPASALVRMGGAGGLFGPFTNPFYGYVDEVWFFDQIYTVATFLSIYNKDLVTMFFAGTYPIPGMPWDMTTTLGPAGFASSWFRMGDDPDSYNLSGAIAPAGTAIFAVSSSLPNAVMGGQNTLGNEFVCDTINLENSAFQNIILTARTAHQPRSTILREPLAKRPVNIRNIRMTTGSTIIGNYSHDYEIVQTSGRLTNNSFFVKNGGFDPNISSPLLNVLGIADFTLPDFSKFGSNKWCFVEKFNAPGGPEVSSRGALDLYAEEYGVYNNLNVRNLVVRNALQKWQTSYNGQFGIDSSRQLTVSGSPPTIIGPGEPEGFRQPRVENYNTLASYHKVNRNGAHRGLYKENWSREVEWVTLVGCSLSNFNRDLDPDLSLTFGFASSNQIIETTGYFEIEVALTEDWAAGISTKFLINDQTYLSLQSNQSLEYAFVCDLIGNVLILESGTIPVGSPTTAIVVGDRLRIFRDKSTIVYQHKPLAGSGWVDLYTSSVVPSGNYYPRAILESEGKITNARISNPRYDNWFIQHSIPQDRLQYAWINKSYDKSVDQPFGHLGSGDDGRTNFSVPFGNPTSLDSPQVQFLTAWTASVNLQVGSPSALCAPDAGLCSDKRYDNESFLFGQASSSFGQKVEILGAPFGVSANSHGDDCMSGSEPNTNFSISAWFKIPPNTVTPSSNEQVIMSRWTANNGVDVAGECDWNLLFSSDGAPGNRLEFHMENAGGAPLLLQNNLIDPADGLWHLAVISLQSCSNSAGLDCNWRGDLWVDPGNVVSHENFNFSRNVTTTAKVYVGAQQDTFDDKSEKQLSGSNIDEVAYWNGPMLEVDVEKIYNNGCPGDLIALSLDGRGGCTGFQQTNTQLVSWWRFAEGQDLSFPHNGQTVTDWVSSYKGEIHDPGNPVPLTIVSDVPNENCPPCGPEPYPQDFVGINSLIYDPIVSSENLLSSSDGNYENTAFGYMCPRVNPAVDELHALLLHRDGPYGYPSWKQIRTGETPVARHQKRNNIITVGPAQFDKPGPSIIKQELLTQIRMGGRWIADEKRREQNLPTYNVNNWANQNPRLSFVEPMVTFKYRSLETRFLSGWTFYDPAQAGLLATSSVQHTFCNNLYYFANADLSKEVGIQWTQGYDPSFTPNDRRPKQMHDVLYEQPSLYNRFKSLIYSEVIYPKEIYTGLNIIRSRVNYTEDAPLSGTFAVADYGDNGIDRDSSRRRSFWSDEWF